MDTDSELGIPGRSADLSHSSTARPRSGISVTGSPLQQAVLRGDTEEVQLFLNSSSAENVNAKDDTGRTLLMLAVEADSPDTIDLLLQNNADPNEGDMFRSSSEITHHLERCAAESSERSPFGTPDKIADRLLQYDAEPIEGNAPGSSALYQAVCMKRHRCAERLLKGGAHANTHFLWKGFSPLHVACANGDQEMVKLLLSSGADLDVDAVDLRFRTPLHVAAVGGFTECLLLLLQGGARLDVQDVRGLTPLGLARGEACRMALLGYDAALSSADLRHLLLKSPVALHQLLDAGVQPGDDDGALLASYKPMRDVGGAGRPFEGEFLTELQRSGRRDLLCHPAVELLLELTRQLPTIVRLTMLKIVWCLLVQVSLIQAIVVDLYSGGKVSFLDSDVIRYSAKRILLVFNCIQLVLVLGRLFAYGTAFFSGRRLPVMINTVLIFVALCLQGEQERRSVYAVAVLISFFDVALAMETMPYRRVSIAISSFLHVMRSIAGYLLAYLPVLIGFYFSFVIMFTKSDLYGSSNHTQGNFSISFMNMAAMVLGEVDVEKAEEHAPESVFGTEMSTILYILFLFFVPLVMLNLLLALTISDMKKVRSESKTEFLRNLANQQAVFVVDGFLYRLKRMMPLCLFVHVVGFSLRLRWQSVLPRSTASVKATPHITIDPLTRKGNVRAVVSGSSRRFWVHSELCESLNRIVETRRVTEAETLSCLSAGLEAALTEKLSMIQERLQQQQKRSTKRLQQQLLRSVERLERHHQHLMERLEQQHQHLMERLEQQHQH